MESSAHFDGFGPLGGRRVTSLVSVDISPSGLGETKIAKRRLSEVVLPRAAEHVLDLANRVNRANLEGTKARYVSYVLRLRTPTP